MKFNKLKHLANIALLFTILLGIAGIADAKARDNGLKINRADIGINLFDSMPYTHWDSYTSDYSCYANSTQCYVSYASDVYGYRMVGLDITTRTSMASMGAKSSISKLFYLGVDGYFGGMNHALYYKNVPGGLIDFGIGASVGFAYPILSTTGRGEYVASKTAADINLNIFSEFGLGYMLGINIIQDTAYFTHTLSPEFALGVNMTFKSAPNVELETAYKIMPGWRNNLYARVQYDFMDLSHGKKMGVHFMLDVLYAAVNTGISIRY